MGKLCKFNKIYLKKYIYLILIILWMITVFLFSEQNGEESSKISNETTKAIIQFTNKTSESLVEKINPYIRKLAHFTLYLIGGLLIANYTRTFDIKTNKKIIYSIVFGAIYASTDELHQLFIAERSASIFDVAIDTLGIMTGVIILFTFLKLRSKLKLKIKVR